MTKKEKTKKLLRNQTCENCKHLIQSPLLPIRVPEKINTYKDEYRCFLTKKYISDINNTCKDWSKAEAEIAYAPYLPIVFTASAD